jgi:hypothetical protein
LILDFIGSANDTVCAEQLDLLAVAVSQHKEDWQVWMWIIGK